MYHWLTVTTRVHIISCDNWPEILCSRMTPITSITTPSMWAIIYTQKHNINHSWPQHGHANRLRWPFKLRQRLTAGQGATEWLNDDLRQKFLKTTWHKLIRDRDWMKITLTFDFDQSATWFRSHCANARRNICQEDLNSFPFAEPEETTRIPSYYVDEDYPT